MIQFYHRDIRFAASPRVPIQPTYTQGGEEGAGLSTVATNSQSIKVKLIKNETNENRSMGSALESINDSPINVNDKR